MKRYSVRRKIEIAAAVLAVALAVWSLSKSQNNDHFSFWRSATKRVEAGFKEITFSELTNFEWDKVCILEPYSLGTDKSRGRRIATLIQGDLGEFRSELPNLDSDGDWAFVFIEQGHVVRIQERGRGYYIYKKYENNCISSNEAKFTVDGKRIYIND